MWTLFSWAQFLIVRIRYSTSRLFVFLSINTKSESDSTGSLFATQRSHGLFITLEDLTDKSFGSSQGDKL